MFSRTKLLAIFGAAFMLPLLIAVANPEALSGTSVLAAEKKQPKYKDVKTRKRQSVGGKCAKALEKVQVVLEEENWPESLKMLNGIEASAKTCASDYEQTQIWKFYYNTICCFLTIKSLIQISRHNSTSLRTFPFLNSRISTVCRFIVTD